MEKSKIIVDGNGKLIIENARILYRNFSGKEINFNREGDRNFCVFIDDPDAANDLKDAGWNVRIRKPRDEDDDVAHYVKVNVSYRFRAPRVVLHTKRVATELTEETIKELDNADIIGCDIVINPSHWENAGKSGISGYLESMHVTIQDDYFADKYAKSFADEHPEE